MKFKGNDTSSKDIYEILRKSSEKKREENKKKFLEKLEVKEFFEKGGITIDEKTCKGIECRLCIDACPTNALFWRSGEIGIAEDLCVYCAACVLSCIVDDCIRVWRKRSEGELEEFSTPLHVLKLLNNIDSEKRKEKIQLLFESNKKPSKINKRAYLNNLLKLRKKSKGF